MVLIALRHDDELDHWDDPLYNPSLLAWAKPETRHAHAYSLALPAVGESLFIHESQKWHLGNVPDLLGILAPRLLTSFTADLGTGQTYDTHCS